MNYRDPNERENVKEILKQGIKSPFWEIICQRLQEHMDSVQRLLDSDHLKGKSAEEYKIETEVLRRQRHDRQGILDMPDIIVHELDNPEFMTKEEPSVYP